jgi:hypothetical protein
MSEDPLQLMLDLLESHRLEVQLVPLNPRLRNFSEGGMKRVAADKNTKWYRELCARHLSSRKRNHRKPDTKIKRANILRILKRLAQGLPSRSKYAAELHKISSKIPHEPDYRARTNRFA